MQILITKNTEQVVQNFLDDYIFESCAVVNVYVGQLFLCPEDCLPTQLRMNVYAPTHAQIAKWILQ